MVLIFSVSADTKSLQHSSTLFEPLLRWLFPGMPPERIQAWHHIFRKCCHLAEYFILAALIWRALHRPAPGRVKPWRWDEAGVTLVVVFGYATTDEFHQIYVPGRTPLLGDVLIDTCGGALALLVLWAGRQIFWRTTAPVP